MHRSNSIYCYSLNFKIIPLVMFCTKYKLYPSSDVLHKIQVVSAQNMKLLQQSMLDRSMYCTSLYIFNAVG